jgi:HlyD family secretion protein
MKQKTLNIKTAILLIIPLVLTAGCSKSDSGEIKAPGLVDGVVVNLKAAAAGTVEAVNVSEGGIVKKGQIVAQIDSQKTQNKLEALDISQKELEVNRKNLRQSLRYTNANIKFLDKQVKRFRRLRAKKAISGEKLESMELRLLQAKTADTDISSKLDALDIHEEKLRNQRAMLELVLNDHRVEAPGDGIVIETFIAAGEMAMPGTEVADIIDTSSLYVELFIEEREISRLALGQKVDILVDGIGDKTFAGTITAFGKKAEFSPKYIISEKEREALLYKVKVGISGDYDVFKIGMPVTVVLAAKG